MAAGQIDRRALIADLIDLTAPLDGLIAGLASFGWDYEGQAVTLRGEHILNVLKRYVAGNMSATEVENWANAIEGREDIEFDSGDYDGIDDVLHELANPFLTQPLTLDRAVILCRKLAPS